VTGASEPVSGGDKGVPMVISSLKLVEADLLRVEERLVGLLEKRGGALKGPAEMMFRSGGKRLRPALVLLSSRLFGSQPESAISIAAAVEMVHGASLIHDDVIDSTDLRRGQPTLNAVTGNRIAVLLGDLLLSLAGRGRVGPGGAGSSGFGSRGRHDGWTDP